jgi:hypothetical protein
VSLTTATATATATAHLQLQILIILNTLATTEKNLMFASTIVLLNTYLGIELLF